MSSFSDNYDTLVENLNCDLHNIHNWLSDNKLQHHLKKCKVMFIGSPRNLSSKVGDKPVLINNAPVPRTGTFTCLGVKLDGKLNWDNHIDSICQKVSAGIGIMRRIKPYVPRKTLIDIYNGLVMPYFDYCSPLWDTCSIGLQDKLQKYQNRAARVISGASYETRSTDVLESFGWETLEKRRLRSKAILMYKILNDHCACVVFNFFILAYVIFLVFYKYSIYFICVTPLVENSCK